MKGEAAKLESRAEMRLCVIIKRVQLNSELKLFVSVSAQTVRSSLLLGLSGHASFLFLSHSHLRNGHI